MGTRFWFGCAVTRFCVSFFLLIVIEKYTRSFIMADKTFKLNTGTEIPALGLGEPHSTMFN